MIIIIYAAAKFEFPAGRVFAPDDEVEDEGPFEVRNLAAVRCVGFLTYTS